MEIKPETDAEIMFDDGMGQVVSAFFSAKLERERDELRAEVAHKQKLIEFACRDWADDDTRIKAVCEKHGIATENTGDYFKSAVECVEQLGAENARLEKALCRIGFYFAGTDNDHVSKKIEAVLCGKSIDEAIDEAIDAAMKGAE